MNLDEFVQECRKSSIIKAEHKEKIDKVFIKKIGVKPSLDGFYYKSQILDVASHIQKTNWKKRTEKIFKRPNDNILKLDTITTDNSAARNFRIQHLLLLISVPPFKKAVSDVRSEFGMPLNGFKNIKERNVWANKYIEAHFLNGKNFSEKEKIKVVNDFILKITHILMGISEEESHTYNVGDFNNFPYDFLVVDYIFFNDPFFNFEKIKDGFKKQQIYGFKQAVDLKEEKGFKPTCFELHTIIYKETTKQDIKDIIDTAWMKIKKIQETLYSPDGNKKTFSDIKRNFMVYQLYQKGMKDREIQQIIRKEQKYKLELSHIRKIISEIQKEVNKLYKK